MCVGEMRALFFPAILKKGVHKKTLLSFRRARALSRPPFKDDDDDAQRTTLREREMKKKKPPAPPREEEEEERVAISSATTTTLLFQFLNPIDSELHRLSTKIEAECFPLLREREIPIAEDDDNREDFDGVKKKDASADGVVSSLLFLSSSLCFCFCI